MFGKTPALKRFEFKKDREGRVDRRSYAIRKDIQEAARETKEKFPEVVGFTMFGSRTKGKEKDDSDIDLVMHIEGEGSEAPGFFEKTLKRLLADSLSYTQAESIMERSHFYFTLLDKTAIAHAIDEGVAYMKRSREKKKDKDAEQKYMEVVHGIGKINPLFFLGVGQGLEPWRKFIIETLEKRGPDGEALWQEMMRELKHFHENRRLVKTEGRKHTLLLGAKRVIAEETMPMTLEAARRRYHISKTA